MESVLILESSVADVDLLIKAADKRRAYVFVLADDLGAQDLARALSKLEMSQLKRIAWFTGAGSQVPALLASNEIVTVLDSVSNSAPLCRGLHFVDTVAATRGACAGVPPLEVAEPYKYVPRTGIKLTACSGALGAASRHLILPGAAAYDRGDYFTQLVEHYPVVPLAKPQSQPRGDVSNDASNRRAAAQPLYDDMLNHVCLASKLICVILMKYKAVQPKKYDVELVKSLDVMFATLFDAVVRTMDPAYAATLRAVSASDMDEKVYLVVALLAVCHGIGPAEVAAFCSKHGIESTDVFVGYMRSGQVVFYGDANCTGRATHDGCMPASRKRVRASAVTEAKCVLLGPRTRLVVHGQPDLEGTSTVIFENASFSDDKVVNSKKWYFRFASYELALLDAP